MNDTLLSKLGIKDIEGTYTCAERIQDGMGARCYFGTNKVTGKDVFIKFLLFPRSSFERARFNQEIYTLEHLGSRPIKIVPKILSKGELFDREVLYLITEKIEGLTLKQWITHKLSVASIDERLEIFHRVVSGVTCFSPIYAHRDLHPGNIILLDKPTEWKEGLKPTPQVRILDWGHSFAPYLASFDDTPDFMLELYHRLPKVISGSFYCTPPDVFTTWDNFTYNHDKHDAWSLGLLLYKLMTQRDLFSFSGIGDFLESLRNKKINSILKNAEAELSDIHHPAANIISKVLMGLTSPSPADRMDSYIASRILWDIRIEQLTLDSESLGEYIRNPHDYQPKDGWKFSDQADQFG
ncbi:MAG: hypothetical protein DU480_14540 [Nitrosomonas sp.]|uniref:protein kinase domain-containing protein n=1 Tax=Nitrosomonas sp. TaxID=42353 RepID=UPI0032EE199A